MSTKTGIFIIRGINDYNINKLEGYVNKLYKRDRIYRLLHDGAKVRAIISEILIRVIYCETKKVKNNEIIFGKNMFGKPFIQDSGDFKFNISHSSDLVVGVVNNEEIGVDVEFIHDLNIERAKLFCTNNEIYNILQKKDEDRCEFITTIWSLKECYIKYLGTTLSNKLKSFDILSKENIEHNVYLYSKKIEEYILCICTKNILDLNKSIEEITIEDLLNKYRKYD